jgi:hypothetical protein
VDTPSQLTSSDVNESDSELPPFAFSDEASPVMSVGSSSRSGMAANFVLDAEAPRLKIFGEESHIDQMTAETEFDTELQRFHQLHASLVD